jgi:hypothetical protein
MPDDRLFVDVTAYHWRRRDELALAAYHTGRKPEAAALWRERLANPLFPDNERARIAQTRRTFPPDRVGARGCVDPAAGAL